MFKKAVFTAAVLVASVVAPSGAVAQSSVEQNSNVVGRTAPGYYRGIPAMQDNEGSCAINPILPRNIVCAWNASGGSDDAIGDTWLRFSEKDAQRAASTKPNSWPFSVSLKSALSSRNIKRYSAREVNMR